MDLRLPRRAALPLLITVVASLLGTSAAACSSSKDEDPAATPPGIEAGGPAVDGGEAPDGGKEQTEIVFDKSTTFGKRECSLTVRYAGGGNEVKLAGEFTDWQNGALPMTKTATGFELTLQPSAKLQGGILYGYKLVVDGTWKIDPAGKYRKIIGGEMNSGLELPECDSGPELLSEKVAVASAGSTGEMKVRVTVRAASDGEPATGMTASLDRAKIPAGSWKIDTTAGAVDFTFPALAKGKHVLSLTTTDGKMRTAAPIDLPFWVEDEAFDYRDGLLYMFMVDRFANGDKSNDKPIGGQVHYDADWHGGDLQGALKVMQSGYFEKLGVRTIWISPANAQTDKSEVGDGNQIFSAYHGYWPVKARAIEPRFGGDAALRAFVTEAHKRGLRVLLDLINNQVHDDHEYVSQHKDWFRKDCKCGDDANGCGWSQRPFDCNFQMYLPDINWNTYGAEKQFISDAVNWISEYDLDGFRVDAVKHVEANSVFNMRAELTRRFEQGGARVFMVGETAVGEGDHGTFFGETFDSGFKWIDAYTGPTALDGQFDFPTRHNMADGLVDGTKPLSDVEAQIVKSETSYRPGNHHVRFLNGHDNPRIASIAAQDPKLGCSWSSGCRDDALPPVSYTDAAVYTKLKRALTVLYSLPGVPYLYSGDEVAFPGGNDPDMRRNMRFEESDLAALHMAKPGSSPAALIPQQIELRDWARKLGATRSASRALRRGDRITLLGNEADLWVYAYKAGAKEIAIVAINRGGAVNRTIAGGALGLASSGITGWTSALGTGSASPSGGDIAITLGAGEAAIFVAK
ncbi:MAG: Periplasmic alpha-amylase [Labilithrix sp.]|nr:Periplasmic alpha-amylase [Labilithrix sp.]